jgi:N-acetylglucosaminyl-diphospho-decaprenol L-rhamnosyltransferase
MAAQAEAHVAVVVVTYNSAQVLPGLLESLPSGLSGVAWHLVVADNASSDDSVGVVRRLAPAATVVETGRNGGYAAGINAAVAAAGPHTAVLVLNPDVRLEPGCVSTLLDVLDRQGVGIVVPRLLDAQGEVIASMRREPTVLRALGDAVLGATRAGRWPVLGEVVTAEGPYAREQATDWAEGSTQLVSAACWQACGPWDERFFLYSEETEFDLRARDLGFETRYVPTAGAVHLEGGSATTPWLWALLVVNRVRLFRMRNGAAHTALFWLVLLARELSRAVLGKPTSRAAVRALLLHGVGRRRRGMPLPQARVSAGS